MTKRYMQYFLNIIFVPLQLNPSSKSSHEYNIETLELRSTLTFFSLVVSKSRSVQSQDTAHPLCQNGSRRDIKAEFKRQANISSPYNTAWYDPIVPSQGTFEGLYLVTDLK